MCVESNSDELNSGLQSLAELHDEGNDHVRELILTGLEELIQLVLTKNRESWDL